MKTKMSFQINRKRWVRGCGIEVMDKYGSTSLLNENGNMCCLGFLAKKCGLKNEDIMGIDDPLGLVNSYEDNNNILEKIKDTPYIYLLDKDLNEHSEIGVKLMQINDRQKDSETREQDLADAFKTIGIQVKFVG